MKGVRLRFWFWIAGGAALFLLANLRLRIFPHILILFWLLLPILSLVFSLLSRSKLELQISTAPSALQRNQEGMWQCRLVNHSKWMAFFLRFPELRLRRGRRIRRLELMLRPHESRMIEFPFLLNHTGTYELRAREPWFEDLLGFFWLSFSARYRSNAASCTALPHAVDEQADERMEEVLQDCQTPIDRKSFDALSDEVFSIEPWVQGQSMAHTHWKLSARLQEWMIRHYSEHGHQPLRITLALSSCAAPQPVFSGIEETPLSEQHAHQLALRDQLLDQTRFLLVQSAKTHGTIELATTVQKESFLFPDAPSEDEIDRMLSSLPFEFDECPMPIALRSDQQQLLLIQSLDEGTLGQLLSLRDLGQLFHVLSFKQNTSKELRQRLDEEGISCMWLDEEAAQ